MRIFVTGGTGFVGSYLLPCLTQAGHDVLLLARPGDQVPAVPHLEVIEGDPLQAGPWWNEVSLCQAAINLAGAPIFGRWSAETKRMIRDSRLLTTRHLVDAIPAARDFTLVSASAVGIYGDAGERELDEGAPLGGDFLAGVAQRWEAEARRAEAKGVRTVVTRFAVVLGPGGGALSQMIKASERFVGGPVGSGRQWFSWIHREDLVRAIEFLLISPAQAGVYNVCSPNPARQIDVSKTLGRLLHRPSFLPAPAFAVRLVLGEFADVVLFSQKMRPRRLVDAGFAFRFPDIESALAEVLAHQGHRPST